MKDKLKFIAAMIVIFLSAAGLSKISTDPYALKFMSAHPVLETLSFFAFIPLAVLLATSLQYLISREAKDVNCSK